MMAMVNVLRMIKINNIIKMIKRLKINKIFKMIMKTEIIKIIKMVKLREATRDKKQLDFGFLLKGGGRSNPNPKLSRNFSKNLFFCLSLDIFKASGRGSQIQTL